MCKLYRIQILIGPRLEAVCGPVGGRSFPFGSGQLTTARRGRIMRLENLIEDHPMTALGNVPCNGCRACCLHNMIPLMPERGDLIWTYKHDVLATAAGPKAVLKCGETGECIYLGRETGPRRSVGHSIAGNCFSAKPAPSALCWPNPAWSRKRSSLPGADGSKRWTCRDDGRQWKVGIPLRRATRCRCASDNYETIAWWRGRAS